MLGDGNFGGLYQRPDAEMLALWAIGGRGDACADRDGWDWTPAMLGFIIQRLLQAMLVMLAMSALVFVGVYAIGNPIDVMISPDATQDIRAARDLALRARPAAVASSISCSSGTCCAATSAVRSSSTCRWWSSS